MTHALVPFAASSRSIPAVIAASGGIAVFAVCLALLALAGRLAWSVVRRRLV